MRLTGSRAYYRSTPPKMPPGLVELVEGLTREVLKNNPTDIYGFCAGHVQQLLEIRDGPLRKKTLTLEEKIAKAQEKVRQRAEQRRQQYNNNLPNQQSGTGPDINVLPIKDDTAPILPEDPTAVHIAQTPIIQNEQESVKSSSTPSKDLQHEDIKELSIIDNAEFKNNNRTESTNAECESKDNINLAETSNKPSGSVLAPDLTLNEQLKTEIPATKVEIEDNLSALLTDELVTQGGIPFKEEASVSQEFNEVAPDTEPNLSSPIDSINVNQDCGLVETGKKITTILKESEKTVDINEQNLLIEAANLISNDIVETQSDNINLPLNNEEPQQSNDTDSIQQFVDLDITNQTIRDNVELTINSDDIVNEKEEDPQETNTFDISFKESPTVELQDPQINSDMLESLIETNSDSDILTLITQESTDDELKPHNDFKHDAANSELPEGKKHSTESNEVILAHEELQKNTQNQINNIDLIDNSNKESTQIDKNENTTTFLSETSQVHNQDGNMDLETAAITIQKVFRTFLFKSRASTFDDTVNDETIFLKEDDKNKEDCDFPTAGTLNKGRPHGITRMDTVLQTVNEEKSLSLSTDDSSTLSSAATVIQAHVRGFLVRNKLNSNKTISTNSLAASNSNEPSLTSLEMDNEQNKNKTVLNIHIVPEGGNYLSRDESLITSMDLSLDSSPPSSINLHPLGYDKSERRKRLKREDAIQSVSPPSNNSGKLSEDVDSVKELPLNDNEITDEPQAENNNVAKDDRHEGANVEDKKVDVENMALIKIVSINAEPVVKQNESIEKTNSDEMDVVSPFILNEDNNLSDQRLMHSGEFHDAVLPTKVSRSDTSVTSEFKNVLVYFLLWNHS